MAQVFYIIPVSELESAFYCTHNFISCRKTHPGAYAPTPLNRGESNAKPYYPYFVLLF